MQSIRRRYSPWFWKLHFRFWLGIASLHNKMSKTVSCEYSISIEFAERKERAHFEWNRFRCADEHLSTAQQHRTDTPNNDIPCAAISIHSQTPSERNTTEFLSIFTTRSMALPALLPQRIHTDISICHRSALIGRIQPHVCVSAWCDDLCARQLSNAAIHCCTVDE